MSAGSKVPNLVKNPKKQLELRSIKHSTIDTVPIWLWDLVSNAYSLNLSTNHIEGMLPNRIRPPSYMDLSSNTYN